MEQSDIEFLFAQARCGAYKNLVFGDTNKYKQYMEKIENIERELNTLIFNHQNNPECVNA